MTMTARAGTPFRDRSAAMRTGEASETGRGIEWGIVRAKPRMEALNEGPSRTLRSTSPTTAADSMAGRAAKLCNRLLHNCCWPFAAQWSGR